MKNAKRLTNEEFTKELFDDVLFFSFAEGDAMGESEAVVVHRKVGTM